MTMPDNEKILLVDDEPELLKSCLALLQASGYEADTALGGKEALAMLKKTSYDLVLLDLNMPDLNGHQVMEFINENKIDTSIIVVSGETSFDWVSKAFQLGAYDYLQKPYEFDGLVNSIKNALRKRKLEHSFSGLRKQLERSEKLHRFMIESSPDIIFIVDKDGCFAFVNDRATDLLGYRKDELIGEHFSSIVDPEYLEVAKHCFSERRKEARSKKDVEIWLNCKTGLHLDKAKIAIDLNALGVYEHDDGDDTNKKRKFSGTYVVARDITERLASEKLIHYQAYHDLLTGLPNRALFLDRLGNAISNARRDKESLSVMFLDLDRFKIVNDSLGHSVGDKLLKQVSHRLKSALREGDTLARLGGDEFILLLPSMKSDEVAHKVGRKIINVIKEPFDVEGHEIFVTASIGVSMYPQDGEDADALIKNADVAMYHTKEQGKNSYSLYEEDMSAKHSRLLSIENDIRRGIKENQFEVFYQPQVSVLNGSVTGVEALLRWNHPKKGLLSPAYFLTVAEDSGLIVELGEWVLDAALSEVKEWRNSGVTVGNLAINFSSRQIEQKDFVNKIIDALKRYEFPGSSLEIEITESTLMSDVDNTIAKLKQLHNVGVQVAIDDFGTGYSSLSLLQKLPINRLKVDRSFIQDIDHDSDRSIIEAIAHMAKGLRLEMVAEGVEEDYQLRYLRSLNCPVIQGFLFSEGIPGSEAKKFVENSEGLLDAIKAQELNF